MTPFFTSKGSVASSARAVLLRVSSAALNFTTGSAAHPASKSVPVFLRRVWRAAPSEGASFCPQRHHRINLRRTARRQPTRQQGHARQRRRGKRSYGPLLCLEAHSGFLWDTELRPGDAGTWFGSVGLLASCFVNVPRDIRELRVRADAGFGYDPVLRILKERAAEYAVVARLTPSLKRVLGGLRYQRLNARWEIAECEHRPSDWKAARRGIVTRRRIEESEPEPTLFTLERYLYRAWVSNSTLSPPGVWRFYEGRAAMEPRIRELREDFGLRRIPTRAFAANAL